MAGAAHSFGDYSVACRQDEGHRWPAIASASDSEMVYGRRQGLCAWGGTHWEEYKGHRPAEPGCSLQMTDAEEDLAESPRRILNHHQVELSS